DAVDSAYSQEGPVCLLDMGDNVGGGSPADSTFLAAELSRRAQGPAFVCLFDPESQREARRAGVGARLQLTMGGKTDELHGAPLVEQVEVVGLFDGKFVETEPRHGGFTQCDQGPTAVVRDDRGLTVMLSSQRMPPFSIKQLTTFDVDPAAFQVLVAKGVNAPVAAYAPVCKQLIRVNTPGCTTADMTTLPFERRRRPLFPFERE
ncbi:MAG: MlrC C-terminal domain-containing protein, partial [Pirellulaceae bacterium]|nr:MlrC C-terminal domain-containing protein [Pirellulaceae bacterium]